MTSNTHKLFAGVLGISIVVAAIFSMGLIASSAEAFSEKKFKTNTTQLIHLGD